MDFLDQLIESSQSSKDPDWKCMLIKLFTEVFSSPYKIESMTHDICDTSFDFISNGCAKYPELFVSHSSNPLPSIQSEFMKWIIQHCVNVMSLIPMYLYGSHDTDQHKTLSNLQGHIKYTLVSLLNIAKRDNSHQFALLMFHYLSATQTLTNHLNNHLENHPTNNPINHPKSSTTNNSTNHQTNFLDDSFPFHLDAFQLHEAFTNNLPSVSIVIHTSDSCLEILTVFFSIFSEMLMHSPILPPSLLPRLLQHSIQAIHCGDHLLKTECLQLVERMLGLGGWNILQLTSILHTTMASIHSLQLIQHLTASEREGFEGRVSGVLEGLLNYHDLTQLDQLTLYQRLQTGLSGALMSSACLEYISSCQLAMLLLCAYKHSSQLLCLCAGATTVRAVVKVNKMIGIQVAKHFCHHTTFPLNHHANMALSDFFFYLIRLERQVTIQSSIQPSPNPSSNPSPNLSPCQPQSFLEVETMQLKKEEGLCELLLDELVAVVRRLELFVADRKLSESAQYLHMLKSVEWLLRTLAFCSSLFDAADDSSDKLYTCEECPRLLSVLLASLCCVSERKDVCCSGMESIVHVLEILLYMMDLYDFDNDFCYMLLGIASLPWISTEVSLRDLRLKEADKFISISNALHNNLNVDVLKRCTHVLCALSKPHIAQQWRLQVVRKIWGEQGTESRCAVVENLAFILTRISPFNHQFLLDVVRSCVEGKEQALEVCLARVSACVVCCLLGKVTVQRERVNDIECLPSFLDTFHFHCDVCSPPPEDDNSTYTTTSPSVFNPPPLSSTIPLLHTIKKLFKSQDTSAKLEFICNYRGIFQHIYAMQGATPSLKGGQEERGGLMKEYLSEALSFIKHLETSVRYAFSTSVGDILPSTEDCMEEVEMVVSGWLEKNICVSVLPPDLLHTLVACVVAFCRVLKGRMTVTSLSILLNVLLFPSSHSLQTLAETSIKQIADNVGMTCKEFFRKNEKDICMALAHCAYETMLVKAGWTPRQMLCTVASIFTFTDLPAFLTSIEHLFIPHLVSKSDTTAATLIKFYANYCNDNYKTLLIRNVGDIFCHLVVNDRHHTESFSFLEMETDLSIMDLLRSSSQVDGQLLIHLSHSYEHILQGVKIYMSSKDMLEDGADAGANCSHAFMADKLQGNLLGILVYFDKHLKSPLVSMQDKLMAFKSLRLLIELVGGRNVTRVRMRMMKTLKIGLQFRGAKFAEVCVDAWQSYVKSIEVRCLGGMLSQVVVCLLPLLNSHPARVAHILSYLVINNREHLHDYLSDLYFLPQLPELIQVNNVLKQYTEGQYSCKGLSKQLERLQRGVTHDCLEVRLMALEKLKLLLSDSKNELHSLILSKENTHPVICKTIQLLLHGCREVDTGMRNLVGQCLGHLGAIDPARLEMKTATDTTTTTTHHHIDSTSFGLLLITEMSKAFLRVNDSIQDCAAYAIQELMKVYKVDEKAKEWKQLPEDVLEILTPLLHSRYKMTVGTEGTELKGAIYSSKKGKTFERWSCTLAGYLGSKLSSEVCKSIYSACFGMLRNDTQTSLFLLPHLTLQLILEDNKSHLNMLTDEMLTVLNDCSNNQPSIQHQLEDSCHVLPSDVRHLASQTVFSLLDHLNTCLQHFNTLLHQAAKNTSGSSSSRSSDNKNKEDKDLKMANDKNTQLLSAFVKSIPQHLLAKAAYNCGFFSRCLLHYESHLRSSHTPLIDDPQAMAFLSKLYISLEEPDGVAGLMVMQHHPPSFSQQILAFESVGKLSDASTCYDQAMQVSHGDMLLKRGLLRNRLQHGEFNSALHLASGIIAHDPSCQSELNRYRVEAAWKLGQWDTLEKFLAQESHIYEWNVGVGKLLHAVKSKDEDGFKDTLVTLRLRQMVPLSAVCMHTASYNQAYENIVRLHMLSELEEGVTYLFSHQQPLQLKHVIQAWNCRLELCQSTYKSQSPILDLHRVLLQLLRDERQAPVHEDISQCWLVSAQVARECGLIQTAHSSLLNAGNHNVFEYCIEKSKWLWMRGDREESMGCLEKTYKLSSSDTSKLNQHDKHLLGKLALQLMHYNKDTNSLDFSMMIEIMRNVKELNPKSEETFFQIAKYYDKVYMNMEEGSSKSKGMTHVVVNSFLMSLIHGSQHIHQSLSRSLTIWLDYTAQAPKHDEVVDRLNKLLSNARHKLSAQQFLVVLPQLVSRICHHRLDVFNLLKEIVIKVMKDFRHQALWSMIAVSKSSYQMRDKRCQEILHRAKDLNPELNKFLMDSMRLADMLIDLCNREMRDTQSSCVNVNIHFKPLIRMLSDTNFSDIMLPLQHQMNPSMASFKSLSAIPSLSSSSASSSSSSSSNSNAFNLIKPIYIDGIEDKVEILHSLQKPKKVSFKGSDGHSYIMLCKPKDDLRKDCRLMESMSFVNRCLWRKPECRKRSLHIRTFMVTPLDEDCGMLEWVNNTNGLRPILLKLYKQKGLQMSGKELRCMQVGVKEPLEKKLKMFRDVLLPRHPPVFHQWFLHTFTDPTSWYNARQRYSRTTAVMSMAGYMLGLGDRHGENILFDATCGDSVHVDFSCLFNKGEEFEYPEVVPFRLTHNMVDAMGPLGYEGVFRKSCEATLEVMRLEMDSLMSILKTFIFDPLVEWKKPVGGRSNPKETGEIKNEQAQTHMSKIENRLRGSLINNAVGLPLCVEGVVSSLIKAARDDENLCRMYIGWAPYM